MTKDWRIREGAGTRIIVLVVACFLGGMALGAYLFYRASHEATPALAGAGGSRLSESTKAVLRHLSSPVDIRFYSLLDPTSTSPALRAYAGRVDQLLSEYQREGGGKINLTRRNSMSDTDAPKAASADGIKPFNLDKGDACFLGIAVACEGRRESLAQLAPEWETALESDITRAIARVISPSALPSAAAVAAPPKPDKTVMEEVKRLVPNFASVPLDAGMLTIREAALKDFQAAAAESETKVKEAQQRLTEARNSGSGADRQAALKYVQQVQAEQTEKLRQIAARTQAQIEALKQLKAGTP